MTLMLILTAALQKLSPYNKLNIHRQVSGPEQVLLYLLLAYPFLSLLMLLALPGNIIVYLSSDVSAYRKAYFVFCIAHVFLSLIASSISYPLRQQSRWFNMFFAFSVLAGGGYLTAVIAALAENARHP
jgi:hypothetical protein